MYEIRKRFEFSAAHRVTDLPLGHKCGRLHGHNYAVEVVVSSPALDARGFCQVDYGEMGPFREWIDTYYDHMTILRDTDPLGRLIARDESGSLILVPFNPTAENLARHFLEKARQIVSPFVSEVRVSETPKTWASYRAPN